MKLKYVNPHNVEELVPAWAELPFRLSMSLDEALLSAFDQDSSLRPARWDQRLAFWVEVDLTSDQPNIQVCLPAASDAGSAPCGLLFISMTKTSLVLPLNPMLKGADKLTGSHCVYVHTILTECPLSYVGVTKQRWFSRLAQHRSAAFCGSHLIFHSALRDHAGAQMQHRVLVAGVDLDSAMALEEEFVEAASLYPKGLNMIPGGFAGLRYLARFGVHAATAADRDAQIERIAGLSSIDGHPNPLCAARWAGDQDFVNRVICGHSGRLTVDQVRQIRLLSSFCKRAKEVSSLTGVPQHKVTSVIDGLTYGRVM